MPNSPLMISSGYINASKNPGQIIYNGVPSPTPPVDIVEASIASSTTMGTSLTFPIDLNLATMPYLQLQLQQFSSYNIATAQLNTNPVTTQGMFYLPIPINLVDANKVEMSQTSLFNELAQIAGGVASVIPVVGPAVEKGLNIMQMTADVAGVAAGGGLNPFKVLLLRGPDFKQFQFNWIFSPRNPTEAQTLAQMLATFKDAKTPTLGGSGLYWNYPYLFTPSFAQTDQSLMYTFKPSVLTDLQVSYNPGKTNSWFRPGSSGARMPNVIEVQMAFIEAELWQGGQFGSGLANPTGASINNAISSVSGAANSVYQNFKSTFGSNS
jgi:hypothetical protein